MRTSPGRIVPTLACCALAIATACTPSLDVSHQFLDESTNPELGLHLGSQLLATFATGQMLPTTSNAVATVWTSPTTFVSTVSGGGGAVPVSVSGTAVDSDADLVADELDVTVAYSGGASEERVLVRTDAFDDYRCFGGAGNCAPAFGTPECVFTPLLGGNYDMVAVIPFVDADGDLNPNANHNQAFRYARFGAFGTSITPFAIPETIGAMVLTGSGTTSGALTMHDADLDVTPGIDTLSKLGFSAWDAAGHLGNEVYCAAPSG